MNITYIPSKFRYNVYFDGKAIETTVTDNSAVVEQWVRDIDSIYDGGKMVVGLDVEQRPHPLCNMSNKSATLQLCIETKCLIVQLFYIDEIPKLFKDFVASPKYTFVGIEVTDNIAKIRNEYRLECKKWADIRKVAKRKWPGRFRMPGLKDLANEVVGLNMEKPEHVCLSDWEARVLSESQIEYACIDAYVSYKIGHKLIIEKSYFLFEIY